MKTQNIITLRTAHIDDIALLKQWDDQEHVIASDPNDDWNWEEELNRQPEWRQMFIAEHNNRPIGFIQIIDAKEEDTHYWGDVPAGTKAIDIWIGDKENLGKGYGTIMMELALKNCFADAKTNSVLVDPLKTNIDAIKFYIRLGFVLIKEETFGEDECMVYEITRNKWLKYFT